MGTVDTALKWMDKLRERPAEQLCLSLSYSQALPIERPDGGSSSPDRPKNPATRWTQGGLIELPRTGRRGISRYGAAQSRRTHVINIFYEKFRFYFHFDYILYFFIQICIFLLFFIELFTLLDEVNLCLDKAVAYTWQKRTKPSSPSKFSRK